MTKKQLVTVLTLSGIVAASSCDSGPSATNGAATDAATLDCPIGTFRPEGIADCVFPADDQNGNPLGVSDNRCALGQPAAPPVCVGDAGERSYLAATTTCAPNYRYEPGACERGGGSGFDAGFATADAVAAVAVEGGDAVGVGDEAGSAMTGFSGTGDSESTGTGGNIDATGTAGAPSIGEDGSAGATVSPADASPEAMSID